MAARLLRRDCGRPASICFAEFTGAADPLLERYGDEAVDEA